MVLGTGSKYGTYHHGVQRLTAVWEITSRFPDALNTMQQTLKYSKLDSNMPSFPNPPSERSALEV
jgi:hypothetical protein